MGALQRYADSELVRQADEIARLARARLERRSEGPRINLAQLVLDMASPGISMHGETREALEECARQAGVHFDLQRPLIPFSAFRDLAVATAGAGGYLVSAETRQPIDILRPWSVTARAGVQLDTGLRGDQAVPKVTAKATPEWLTTEGTQVTPSQPTLEQIVLTPKNVGAVVNFSRQLSKQANAEAFVGRELMRTVGTAVDQAVLSGSGAAGQPTGLLLTSGVQTESGTSINAGVRTMKRKVAEANVADERIAFLSTPLVRELLEGREIVTGSGRFVWDDDEVNDRPAYVSTDVPSATMIAGDFGNIYVGIWGEAFVLEINPYDPAGFKKGVISARIILSCDVAVLHAAGFVKAETIT